MRMSLVKQHKFQLDSTRGQEYQNFNPLDPKVDELDDSEQTCLEWEKINFYAPFKAKSST